MPRIILHVDLDAFYCSVEELLDPSLRGKAFVVGGSPEGRGVVSSASYGARQYGIRSAMPTAQALRLAPNLKIVAGHHRDYGRYSEAIMDLLRDSAPLVEQLSIDEAFLDVSDDPLPGEDVARGLQTEIRDQFDLPTSWGVASNKLVAKIATEVGKPNGLIVVPNGQESDFLAPLPVEMLWGVGPKTGERLQSEGIITIGDLAKQSEEWLINTFGEHGLYLASRSLGQDNRPVLEGREAKSMSSERTFSQDVSDRKQLETTLLRLSEQVGRRLRKGEIAGTTVRVKIRWPDFTTITRQTTLHQSTDRDKEIFDTVLELFHKEWTRGRAVRLLGVGVSNLGTPIRQLDLFDQSWEEDERLLKAIDSIRKRYGPDAVRRAGALRPTRRSPDADQTTDRLPDE
jgi:DNA polymerase-4